MQPDASASQPSPAIDPFRGPELPHNLPRADSHPWQDAYNLRLVTNLFPAPGYDADALQGSPAMAPPVPDPAGLSRIGRFVTNFASARAVVTPEQEWHAAYHAQYGKLLDSALGIEIAMVQDRPDVEATDAAVAMVRANSPLRLTFAETLWHYAGREPDIPFEAADGELQQRARYAALYDFFFCDQPESLLDL